VSGQTLAMVSFIVTLGLLISYTKSVGHHLMLLEERVTNVEAASLPAASLGVMHAERRPCDVYAGPDPGWCYIAVPGPAQ
jgi:hypothetical protein